MKLIFENVEFSKDVTATIVSVTGNVASVKFSGITVTALAEPESIAELSGLVGQKVTISSDGSVTAAPKEVQETEPVTKSRTSGSKERFSQMSGL